MSTAMDNVRTAAHTETEYVTFYVGDILIGIDITRVDEINRHVEVTPVPHAPPFVCGVLNLRGEVVTVIDLRMVLGMTPQASNNTRTVIVRTTDEQIGLRVDRISEVVMARSDEIDPVPPNLGGADGRFFEGVYKMDTELLSILNVNTALAG